VLKAETGRFMPPGRSVWALPDEAKPCSRHSPLTQQKTSTPCYAALAGLCSDPPKHTMIVIPAPPVDGWMPTQQEELPNATDASLRPRDRIHRD
jgi:hypothetical protein